MPTIDSLDRYAAAARKSRVVSSTAKPWRLRVKPKRRPLLPAEKVHRAENADSSKTQMLEFHKAVKETVWNSAVEAAERFPNHGNARQHYRRIMACPIMPRSKRRPSRWIAFSRNEVKTFNDKLPEGTPRHKVSDPVVMGPMREKWAAMSPEEKVQATEHLMPDLEEYRRNKKEAKKSVPLSILGDVHRTAETVARELSLMFQRTDSQWFFVISRGDDEHYHKPITARSSDRILEFFASKFDMSVQALAGKFEIHCLGGDEAEKPMNYAERLRKLRSSTAELIVTKLQDASGNRELKMEYVNFPRLTERYGVMINGWPKNIPFESPHRLCTREQVEVLYGAFQSGATHFVKLTDEERMEWDEARFQELMREQEQGDDDDETPPSGGADTNGLDGNTTPDANAAPDANMTPDANASSDANTAANNAAGSSTAAGSSSTKRRSTTNNPRPAKRAKGVTVGTSADGAPIVVEKKKRQIRSDAGKKRGPRAKKPVAAASEAAPPAGAAADAA